MIYGWIAASVVGDLLKIAEIMKTEKYQIFDPLCEKICKASDCNDFTLQDVDIPKHTATAAKTYLDQETYSRTISVPEAGRQHY